MKVEIFGPQTKEQQHWVIVLKMMNKVLEMENQSMVDRKNQAVENPGIKNRVVKNQIGILTRKLRKR